MASSSISSQQNQIRIRSSSFPSKSQPFVQKIEKELKKIRKLEASSSSIMQTISIGLLGLGELYKCVGDVLSLPLTHQTLSARKYDNHVKQLVEGSSKLAEICTKSIEILGRFRAAIKDVQKDGIQTNISKYFSTRKEIMRDAKMLKSSLTQLDENLLVTSSYRQGDQEEVIRVMKCVSIINVSITESLLSALSMPLSKPKSSSLISKLVGKRKQVLGEDDHKSELSNVDAILHSLCSSSAKEEMIHVAQQKLESLNVALGGYENGLHSISTQLTKIRASLVNIISM